VALFVVTKTSTTCRGPGQVQPISTSPPLVPVLRSGATAEDGGGVRGGGKGGSAFAVLPNWWPSATAEGAS